MSREPPPTQPPASPPQTLAHILSRASSPIILDGALATALESLHGLDISTRLWSAAALTDHPDAIADVHYAYFRDARADIGITAS
ncbi:hypothetical protein LTS18_006949, partial [Coniosporium uncinatum]